MNHKKFLKGTFHNEVKVPHLEAVRDLQPFDNAEAAFARINEIYHQSTQKIRDIFAELNKQINTKQRASLSLSHATYPYVALNITSRDLNLNPLYAYGVATEAGIYGTTVTRPDMFRDYYLEQIKLLLEHHKVDILVGVSDWPIPLPFVIEHTPSELNPEQLWKINNYFVMPKLSRIEDDIANCVIKQSPIKPLALFHAERVDFSLHRLHHYTATSAEHFQKFIILTNYQRYVELFIEFSKSQLGNEENYTDLILPGDISVNENHGGLGNYTTQHLPQMPAYHLKRADGQGITFINIGVGPSNAKTITDHLAVLRPHCWLMLGHCAGLRPTQTLGDYVLAHAYVREDHVLDQDLPTWVPLPAIAEVQVALQQSVENVLHYSGLRLKTHMRTGTVISTDNRNWEMRTRDLYNERFRQSRAIAIDMESATVAANGFRFRVPYGTLLCVSDKPLQGEIKLRKMANSFYENTIQQHLEIGLEAIRILRKNGIDQLHSRKLRGFDEPPFR